MGLVVNSSLSPQPGSPSAGYSTRRPEEQKGIARLRVGAGVGLLGGIAAIVLPIVLLWLASHDPGSFFTLNSTLVDTTGVLVLAGAVLLLASFFLFRLGFSALRMVDRRFAIASVLCLVGSIGFLLILISASVLVGAAPSLLQCIHQSPTHALSCVRAGDPIGADAGLVGFWLGWFGGLGIAVGLLLAGRRYKEALISSGAVFYAMLLVAFVGPFAGLLTPLPGIDDLLLVVPVFIILAPSLVLGGMRRKIPSH